ncbi:MAG: ABC transporter substrate-binding protein [Coleofasciculaceae cyanobacterium]
MQLKFARESRTNLYRCLGILFLISVVGLIACSITVTPKTESQPLRILYEPWPGFLPLIIAQEKGFFAQQQIKVAPILTKDVGANLAEFVANKYDGVTLALGSALTNTAVNPDIRIILTTDVSAGADAIIAQPQIKTVADLKNKLIGVRLGGFGELFVNKMLEMNNMSLEDTTKTNVIAKQTISLLQSGKVQAGHTWEPHVTQARQAGLKVLFTSKQTPGLIPDVIVFHNSVLQQRPNEVRAFVKAWFQAVDYWQNNPKEGNLLIAKFLNIKPETISLDGVKLLNLRDNQKAFTLGDNTESLYYTTKLYLSFFKQNGTLNHSTDLEQLLDSSFLQ